MNRSLIGARLVLSRSARGLMLGAMVSIAAGTVACNESSMPSGVGVANTRGDLSTAQADSIQLEYMCGTTFRVRHFALDSATVRYEVQGTADTGSVHLVGRDLSATHEDAYFSTSATDTVHLYYVDRLIETEANEGDPCPPSVQVVPPDTVPAWIFADSNMLAEGPDLAAKIAAQVLLVAFDEGTHELVRGMALAAHGLTVAGGYAIDEDVEGLYLVRAAGVRTFLELDSIAGALRTGGSVSLATVALSGGGEDYLLPLDGDQVGSWEVSPGDATGANWALERIAAPQAWGCSVGNASVNVGVVDYSFPVVADLSPNISTRNDPPTTAVGRHGVAVASIIGARGDNGVGMSGVMWRAALHLRERASRVSASATVERILAPDVAAILRLSRHMQVINISGYGLNYPATGQPYSSAYLRARQEAERIMTWLNSQLAKRSQRPLIVVSAGNRGVDAAWNVFPMLAQLSPSHTLVVGSSDASDAILGSSNLGSLVTVLAPGVNVAALDESGSIAGFGQTSAATPLVAGVAGLLFAFDPNLTAAEVRDLVVAGAILGARAPSGYPVVNAYESLRLAARRTDAPLCGNRLWQLPDGTIHVSRGQTSETIISGITDPFEANFVNLHHGGRRMELAFGNRYQWLPSTRSWIEDGWPGDSIRNYSGSFKGSGAWFQDHADSISTQFSGARVPGGIVLVGERSSLREDLFDGVAVSHTLSLVLDTATTTECVKEWRTRDSVSVGPYNCESELEAGAWEALDDIPWTGSHNLLHALAPQGDFAIIPIYIQHHTRTVGGSWGPCFGTEASRYPDIRCRRDIDSSERPSRSLLVRVDFDDAGGSWRLLNVPALHSTDVPSRVFWLAIGEGGDELVVQSGAQMRSSGTINTVECRYPAHRWLALAGHGAVAEGVEVASVAVPGMSLCNGEVDGGAALRMMAPVSR
ncbi:MAG: S8 family peptidase [Gemmatimonadaceae bacterium]